MKMEAALFGFRNAEGLMKKPQQSGLTRGENC